MRVATKLFLFAAGVIVLFLIVGTSSYFCVSKLIENDKAVEHSEQVLSELNRLMYNVTDAINTQRAYLISGQDGYQEGYHQAVAAAHEGIARIRTLVDDPVEKQKFERFSSLLEERFASLEVTLQVLREKGRDAAIERVRNGKGWAFRMQLHQSAEAIKSVELQRLRANQSEMMRSANSAQMVILSGTALALVFSSFYTYLFAQQILHNVGRLLRVSSNLEHGRFDVIADSSSSDEFGELSAGFNRLGQKLRVVSDRLSKEQEDKAKLQSECQQLLQKVTALQSSVQSVLDLTADKRYSLQAQADATAEAHTATNELAEAASHLTMLTADADDCVRQSHHATNALLGIVQKIQSELNQVADKSQGNSAAVSQVCADAESMHDVLAAIDRLATQLDVLHLAADVDSGKADGRASAQAILRKLQDLSTGARKEQSDLQKLHSKLVYACQKLLLLDRDSAAAIRSVTANSTAACDAVAKQLKLKQELSDRCQQLQALAATLQSQSNSSQAAMDRLLRDIDLTRGALSKISLIAREVEAETEAQGSAV